MDTGTDKLVEESAETSSGTADIGGSVVLFKYVLYPAFFDMDVTKAHNREAGDSRSTTKN